MARNIWILNQSLQNRKFNGIRDFHVVCTKNVLNNNNNNKNKHPNKHIHKNVDVFIKINGFILNKIER